jgi:hypothetical protein
MANNRRPATIGEAIQRLKLFNEKLQTLRERKFIPQMRNNSFTLTFSSNTATWETEGPEEESRLAMASTLRMFVQPQDGINAEQIAELYESLPVEVDPKAKESARKAANGLKEYFAKPTDITFQGEVLTNGRLFEVFMYGNLAHANDDKRADYEKWTKHPGGVPMKIFFDGIVIDLLKSIFSFHSMHERTIQQLETFSPDRPL